MRGGGILFSVAFHGAVVAAVVIGLPSLRSPAPAAPPPIPVEIVRVADIANPPKGAKPAPPAKKPADADKTTTKEPVARDRVGAPKKPEPKKAEPKEPKPAEPKQEAKKTEPKPEPKPEPKAEAPPQPEPKPKPKVEIDPDARKKTAEKPKKKAPDPKAEAKSKKPQVAEATPQAKPEPKPEPKPESQPEPRITGPRIAVRPHVRPRTPKRVTEQAARRTDKPRRDKPKNALDSVFKTVKRMARETAPPSDRDRAAERKKPGVKKASSSAPLTISEIEAVRRQIQPCWNFPAGAPNADSLLVEVRLYLRRDGTLIRAELLGRGRMAGNAYLRAAGEAALRAVRNPRCSPLRLPAGKYDRWKVIKIEFDPSKLKTG